MAASTAVAAERDLVALVDRINFNLAALFPPTPARGMRWGMHEEAGFRWIRTDPSEYPNWVFDIRATPDTADRLLDGIVARIADGELPPIVIVSPHCAPNDLAERLEARGFTLLTAMPGMALELAHCDPAGARQAPARLPHAAAKLEIRTIDTDAEFEDWVRVNRAGFEGMFFGTGCELSVYRTLRARTAPAEVRFYGAWLDGALIGAAQAIFHSNRTPRLVELHQCSVLPAYRQSGIGRRLVTMPLAQAHARGFEVATLFAAAKAESPFWTSIGFRRCCRFRWYVPGGGAH